MPSFYQNSCCIGVPYRQNCHSVLRLSTLQGCQPSIQPPMLYKIEIQFNTSELLVAYNPNESIPKVDNPIRLSTLPNINTLQIGLNWNAWIQYKAN